MPEVPNLKLYLRRLSEGGASDDETYAFMFDPSAQGGDPVQLQVSLSGGISTDEYFAHMGLSMQVANRAQQLMNDDPELWIGDAYFTAQEELLTDVVFNWMTVLQMLANNHATVTGNLLGRIEDLEQIVNQT